MSARNPFGKPSLWLLFGGGGLAVFAFIGALVFGGAPTVRSHEADRYSYSAVGHSALIELLEATGRQVTRSRRKSGAKAGNRALLLVFEPRVSTDPEWLRTQLEGAHTTVIVLPRFTVDQHPEEKGHVGNVESIKPESVLEAIQSLGFGGGLVRTDQPVTFRPPLRGLTPSLPHPQLMTRSTAPHWIRSDAGGLLLEKPRSTGGSHWLLTDPTIIQNHGIDDGNNTDSLLAVLDRIAPDLPIVVDEVAHGHRYTPGPLGELGRFPLVLTVVHAALLSLLVVYAGTRRFGAAHNLDRQLERGKPILIDTTARLRQEAGRTPASLTHYLQLAIRRVSIHHHLVRAQPDQEQLRAQLAQLETRRRPSRALAEIDADVGEFRRSQQTEAALGAANAIQRWSEEMIDGTR